jgi:hypothetical protein
MLGKLAHRIRHVEPELSNPREVTMTVTDTFRVADDRVGVAGLLLDSTLVRVRVGVDGPDGDWLMSAKGGSLAPFQAIQLKIGDAPPDTRPPFTDVRMAARTGHRILGQLPFEEVMALLEESRAPCVREMFGAQVHLDASGGKDWFVATGDGERSLGTVKVAEVLSVTTRRNREGGLDMRLAFRDASGETYKLTIVDLLAQGYLALRTGDGYMPQQLAQAMRLALQRQRLLYLRIALAEPPASHTDRCYLQIAGIITGQTASQAYGEAWDAGIQLM